MAAAHDPYAALRHRDYRLLLSAGVLASIGAEIETTAVAWEIYLRTKSAAALGLSGLAQFLPVLLLALPAGHAADRYSRKLLFQLAQGLALLAALSLAVISHWQGPVALMFACLVVSGAARALTAPTRSSLLAQVVPLEALGNAVTWNSSGWQFANVAGPAIGGLSISAAGGEAAPAYLLAAACLAACVVLLVPVRPRIDAGGLRSTGLANSLLAGARFVWRTELILAAITLDLFAVLLGGATALLPIFARDILHVGEQGFGWLRAAPAMGAVVVAFWLAHRRPLRRPGVALLLAVAGFGAATVAFGLSTNYWLSLFLLALTGALDNINVVVRGTLVQRLTPDDMRGRVGAINSVFISSSNELGEFESGITAELFGPVLSVVGGGIGTVIVVLLVAWHWPRLVQLGPLHEVHSASKEEVVSAAHEESAGDGTSR